MASRMHWNECGATVSCVIVLDGDGDPIGVLLTTYFVAPQSFTLSGYDPPDFDFSGTPGEPPYCEGIWVEADYQIRLSHASATTLIKLLF